MTVTRRQVMNELYMELDKTKLDHTEDNFAYECDRVVMHWKSLATDYLDRGYSTGEYRDSIHRESIRATRAEGGNRGGWKSRAVTFDPIAHLLEYGTGPDQDGKAGRWFGLDGQWHKSPDTPTPAYGLAAQVELDMNGTIAKRGRRRRKSDYQPISRGGRPTNADREAEWVENNPEQAERRASIRAKRNR